MKVVTILGTRPEIIRLSRVIERLDAATDHVLVHTGQNHDRGLSEIFFEQLGVRAPDHHLHVQGAGFGERVGQIIAQTESLLRAERPDRLLVLGDTDSALSAIVAKRLGITVFHMEAGNRCFDDRVPEEVNRRIIDHSSDVLLPYTESARRNLLQEGISPGRILVTGNPIREVLDHHVASIDRAAAAVLRRLEVQEGGYLLLTAHRQETVDQEDRLRSLIDGVLASRRRPTCRSSPASTLARETGSRSSVSPSTRSDPRRRPVRVLRLRRARASRSLRPLRQRHRAGGVLHLPRAHGHAARQHRASGDARVRQQHPERSRSRGILRAAGLVMADRSTWSMPPEYRQTNVSSTVARIVLGRLSPRRH